MAFGHVTYLMRNLNATKTLSNFTVLVIGSDTRAFLSIVRSLGRRGARVIVAPFEFSSAALKSKYISDVVRLPLASLSLESWSRAMGDVCSNMRPDLIIPCDERGIFPIIRCRAGLRQHSFALPNTEACEIFFNKLRTREAAAAEAIPVPEGRPLWERDDAHSLVDEFGLPLFIKPASSYILRDLQARRNVKMCRSVDDVSRALGNIEDISEFFVEKEFRGEGVGVSILSDNGEVLQIFQHRRVHEPRGGGASSYRRSDKLDPLLDKYTRLLCRRANLSGVAMFEYKKNLGENRFALLEVNARFWGSLPLAIYAGVDFPAFLVEQNILRKYVPRVRYRENVFARNLLSDAYSLIDGIRASDMSRKERWSYALRWLASHRRVLSGTEVHDVFWWSDPAPAGKETTDLLQQVLRHVANGSSVGRYLKVKSEKRKMAERINTIKKNKIIRILFVCYGNICRSPYAAIALRKRLTNNKVQVESAALVFRDGRSSPENAIAVAGVRGVDLVDHRSVYASDETVSCADVVFCFDQKNLQMIADRGTVDLKKVFLLGNLVFAKQYDGEIADPVGKERSAFVESYNRIDAGLSVLVEVFKRWT